MVLRSGRLRLKVFAILGTLVIILLTIHNIDTLARFSGVKHAAVDRSPANHYDTTGSPFTTEDRLIHHAYWSEVFQVFHDNRLNFTGIDPGDVVRYIDKSQQKGGPKSKSSLLSKAFVSEDILEEFRRKHENLVNSLPFKTFSRTYQPKSRGIVMVGGGRFSWLSYLAIRALRTTGLTLPVELILPKFEDFEKDIELCMSILPKVNARCIITPLILGPHVMKGWSSKLSSYQLKALALMTSLFQHVLLMDSDNLAILNPDSVFDSDIYLSNGMITWPDYWERTISPYYYHIAGIKVDEQRRIRYNRIPLSPAPGDNVGDKIDSVPYHDLEGAVPNLSTESGQMFINKGLHSKTLLLALYYNVFGPNLYYKLLSLGEQGEGDKDTFVTAAIAVGDKFYQVKSFIKTLGYFDDNNDFQGVAMGQKNPLQDEALFQNFLSTQAGLNKNLEEKMQEAEHRIKSDFDAHNSVPIMFMHCNYPKWDPINLQERDLIYDLEKNKLRYRLYNGFKYEKSLHVNSAKTIAERDFELDMWVLENDILCVEQIQFDHFKDQDMSHICNFISNQVSSLQATL